MNWIKRNRSNNRTPKVRSSSEMVLETTGCETESWDDGEIIMSPPSPLSVLSGALKIADKVTVTMEAAGDKFA